MLSLVGTTLAAHTERQILRCVVVGQAAGRILAGLERATGPP